MSIGEIVRGKSDAGAEVLEELLELYTLPGGAGLAAKRHPRKKIRIYAFARVAGKGWS